MYLILLIWPAVWCIKSMGGQPAAACARVLKRVVTGVGALERGGGGGARTGDVEVLADGGAEVRRDGVQEAGAPHHDGAGPARTVRGPRTDVYPDPKE